MNFFERKGFRGEKEFIFHLGKVTAKICNLLKIDAMARWHDGLASFFADHLNNFIQTALTKQLYPNRFIRLNLSK